MKKIISTFLTLLLVFASFPTLISCGNWNGTQEKVDPNRTQLYVDNYNGGFGSDWLYAAKARFEEEYKDVSFESGKTGVQIMPITHKNYGLAMETNLNGEGEVFFNEMVYYYDFLARDLMLDITDVVTEPLGYGETGTIEQKLTPEQSSYYKTDDGKYYAIPHYAGYNGIIYNVDLFDDYLLYFRDTAKGSPTAFVNSETDKKSAGPDGEYNTSDDGLPATYDEFFKLCDYMVANGVKPFVWPGQYFNTYIEKVIAALQVDFDGLDETMLNYTFRGTSNKIIDGDVAADGTYTLKNDYAITPDNAYELYASEGRYQSLAFWERIIRKSSYYMDTAFSPAHTHIDAQRNFLESVPEGSPIGMIIEGVWWEEESKETARKVADFYDEKYARENRRFAMLPLPKANESLIGEQNTIIDTQYSVGWIKKSIAEYKIPLAKAFLRFVNTDRSLQEFTTITGTVKALSYELTDEQYDGLTYFGQSVYDMHKNSVSLYPVSKVSMFTENMSYWDIHESYYSVGDQKHPVDYFRAGASNTAVKFFNGMRANRQKQWNIRFSKYFD